MKKKLMIYGATGYSGKLLAGAAKSRGMDPCLAGRSEEKVKAVADRLGFKHRAFELGDAKQVDKSIHDMDVLVNTAGPFSRTSVALLESCLRTGTHYLDLSAGMADNFETLMAYGADAKRVLMKYADRQPEGPSEEERNRDRSVFVITAEGKGGRTASARLTTPEGYKLTCMTTLLIAEKVLKGRIQTDYATPTQVFGPDLIMEIEGVKREDLQIRECFPLCNE
ncbi:MAG TPA: saccharopine dehydrogenase NADP-binding domain-containing protein [Spirochaetota bacterium]|nr:saccharopine dehydrogenase NADP-binding domain-containing protein [Spirochaetota bacterium]HPV41909.1 saccharopine dehydrogenase NADP-binding domain-containing protein [Spirochaetota bacterium]